jgi:N6-L-threonylcarbamoyladenine synthase
MLVLGIETTCDETAAAVVERRDDGHAAILANVVLSQIAEHAAFGGVVPEIAARAHVEALDLIIATAMADAGRDFGALDGVAAAAGPGLIGGVIVGLTTAKAIAIVHEKPLIAVNHLEAHALTARLTDGTPFPYCLFLASGGHTQIVAVRGVGDYVRLGTTRDDAIGEAFDKTAKLLGLGYPGGPRVEQEATRGDGARFMLPRPMIGRRDADFSYPASRRRFGWRPKRSRPSQTRTWLTCVHRSSSRWSRRWLIVCGRACGFFVNDSVRPPPWWRPVGLRQTVRSVMPCWTWPRGIGLHLSSRRRRCVPTTPP